MHECVHLLIILFIARMHFSNLKLFEGLHHTWFLEELFSNHVFLKESINPKRNKYALQSFLDYCIMDHELHKQTSVFGDATKHAKDGMQIHFTHTSVFAIA